MAFFFSFKKGKLPGPGAAEYAFQRAFYDPAIGPIGAGVQCGSLMITQEKPLVAAQVAAPILHTGPGVQSGQAVLQPLYNPNGDLF